MNTTYIENYTRSLDIKEVQEIMSAQHMTRKGSYRIVEKREDNSCLHKGLKARILVMFLSKKHESSNKARH